MNAVTKQVVTELEKRLDGPTVWELSNRAEKAGYTSVADYLLAEGKPVRKPQARKPWKAQPLRRSPESAEEARLIRVGVSSSIAQILAVEVSRRKR